MTNEDLRYSFQQQREKETELSAEIINTVKGVN